MEADFSGYATKAGLKCSDGRTIMPDAFKHQDAIQVPLVWQHGHSDIEDVLGHAILEHRPDGVYTYGFFNDTPKGQNAKQLVHNKDITKLSIWANQLIERGGKVLHGVIREVSLVLSGANPGAVIDKISIRHDDGEELLDDEAIIYTGIPFELVHADNSTEGDNTMPTDETTVQDVYDSFDETQKNVVAFMIQQALEDANTNTLAQSALIDDLKNTITTELTEFKEGITMSHNVFDQSQIVPTGQTLSHDDMKSILTDAKTKGSFKEAINAYAILHNITNIDLLFPDAKNITGMPEFNKRRTEWVTNFLNGTSKSPFNRIKTLSADITWDNARAKGYVKGNLKKEEFIAIGKRITTPTTVYKKQILDRDDMVDITDFDIVSWLKMEMRLMLDEELARAALIGDGRDPASEDKVNESAIRPIAKDHELFTTQLFVNIDDASSTMTEVSDVIIGGRKFLKGSGMPTMYTTETYITRWLTLRDSTGRRLYNNLTDLASELRVSDIVPVEALEDEPTVVAILVNPADYTFGATLGGQVSMFDDFDIDYNRQKYLIETRCCGALTKLKSALVIKKVAAGITVVTPVKPTYNAHSRDLTIPTVTGVIYKLGTYDAVTSTYTAGVTTATTGTQAPASTVHVVATPSSASYVLNSTSEDAWTFIATT